MSANEFHFCRCQLTCAPQTRLGEDHRSEIMDKATNPEKSNILLSETKGTKLIIKALTAIERRNVTSSFCLSLATPISAPALVDAVDMIRSTAQSAASLAKPPSIRASARTLRTCGVASTIDFRASSTSIIASDVLSSSYVALYSG